MVVLVLQDRQNLVGQFVPLVAVQPKLIEGMSAPLMDHHLVKGPNKLNPFLYGALPFLGTKALKPALA
jgi:hypothetical protein